MEKLDNMLFLIAGRLIRVVAFFGITRWQAIVIWIYVSIPITFMIPMDYKLGLNKAIFFLLLAMMAGLYWSPIILKDVRQCYREDNIKANNPLLQYWKYRIVFIVFLLVFPSLSMFLVSISDPKLIPSATAMSVFLVLKLALPVGFWLYFCLNQSPKNPVTLRGLIRSLAAKLRKALTPTPLPRPVPQPVSSFAPPS